MRRRPLAAALIMGAVLTIATTGCSGAVLPSAGAVPAASPSPVVIPVDVERQGSSRLVIVPVRVDGMGPYPFILDTGASTSGINAALAAQLKLPKTGASSTVSGVVSSSKVALVRVAAWSVGGVALHPTTIGALTFGSSDSMSGPTPSTSRIAGLLGSDQLSRFGSITIDYRQQQLRFTPTTG